MNLSDYMQSRARGAATEATATQGDRGVFAGVPGGLPVRKSLPLGAVSAVGGGTSVGVLVLYAVIAGAGGYFAGKAMAPSPSEQMGYGLGGAALSIVLGPIGLGALGIYSLVKR